MAFETLENLKRAVIEYDTEGAARWVSTRIQKRKQTVMHESTK